MHIHIAFAGVSPNPTINTIKAMEDTPDAIILLYGKVDERDIAYENKAKDLQVIFEAMRYKCEIRSFLKFDFLDIVDTIHSVYETYMNDDQHSTFSVDITTGTNLMSAAACNTAFFTGADVYYMRNSEMEPDKSLKELLVKIPSPRIPDIRHLGEDTLTILRFIEEESRNGRNVTNSDIGKHFNRTPQSIKYHTDRLLKSGLIERIQAYSSGRANKRIEHRNLSSSFSHIDDVNGKENNRIKPFQITRNGKFVLRCK